LLPAMAAARLGHAFIYGRDLPFVNYKAASMVSIALSVIAVLFAGWYHDWVGACLGIYSLVFAAVCAKKGNSRYSMYCLVSSVIVLVGVVVLALFLPYSLVEEGMDVNIWGLANAAVHSFALPFLAVESFYFMAAAYHSSFNWMLVAGFVFFIGEGMVLPGFVGEFIEYLLGTSDFTTNAYALLSLIVPVLFMFITAVVAWRVMRPNKYLITDEGRVKRK